MDSVEQRLAALEEQVQELRERVTDTHTLAAHADRDVAEFRGEVRAQTRLINLTREDMSNLRGDMSELQGEMANLRSEVRAGFEAITRLLTPRSED